jgi:hypothetical protein
MANSSDILNSRYPSPTKRVGVVTGAGSLSYTAASPVLVHAQNNTGGSALVVDGCNVANSGMATDYYLQNMQSTTVSSSSSGFILSVRRID